MPLPWQAAQRTGKVPSGSIYRDSTTIAGLADLIADYCAFGAPESVRLISILRSPQPESPAKARASRTAFCKYANKRRTDYKNVRPLLEVPKRKSHTPDTLNFLIFAVYRIHQCRIHAESGEFVIMLMCFRSI